MGEADLVGCGKIPLTDKVHAIKILEVDLIILGFAEVFDNVAITGAEAAATVPKDELVRPRIAVQGVDAVSAQ